jgi:uncharacterized protein YprB with RNaseH-like and TPR domain
MRDLTSRLRSIVRQDIGSPRSLTYVPELPVARDAEDVAARLGGSLVGRQGSACIAIDTVWDDDHSHGRRRVSSYRLEASQPLGLFDRRAGALPDWAERVVFFDVETTGLSGGAGTVAFLVGCGWFEADGFRVRQFLLGGPAGEKALLESLGKVFDEATLVVTYNGRSFDVPLMETRWAFHRTASPTDDLPHFDMLPPARRLWGAARHATQARSAARCSNSAAQVRSAARFSSRDPDDFGDLHDDVADPRSSCTLTSLERTVLGFHRLHDVPGFEIPARYFHFLRTGDPAVVAGVLEHNRHDLLSLAAVMSYALWLAQEGPLACRESREQVGLGRLYERAGDTGRALEAYELATSADEHDVRCAALERLAVLLRRSARYDEAAAAWKRVLELVGRGRGAATPLARRAAEALAIHHEHRARDLSAAKRYAETLKTDATGRFRQEVAHRLGRLDRKLSVKKGRMETGLNWDAAE